MSDPIENRGIPGLEKQTISRLSRRILPIMFLLYFVAFVDRISLGIAQLTMGEDIGLDPAIFGLAAGIFFAGYILFEIPSNIALDKYGARIWLTRIGITWGLMTILTGFVQNDTQLLIARFLLGVAEAGLAPGMVLYLMRMYPREHRGRANGIVFLGAPLASAIAGPVCGIILDHAEWLSIPSWRWMFVLTGIPAVLLGAVTYLGLADRPATATWLTAEQRSWLEDKLASEPRTAEHKGSALWLSLRNRNVLALSLAQFLITSGAFGLAFWSPQIIKGLAGDVSATAVGLLVFIPYTVAAIGIVANGSHSDRTGERTLHAALPPALAGVALLALSVVSEFPAIAFVFLVIATLGITSYGSPFWAIAQKALAGSSAPVSIATVTTLGSFGGLLAPYVFGVLTKTTGSNSAGVIYLGVGLMAAGLVLVISRDRWSPSADTHEPVRESQLDLDPQ